MARLAGFFFVAVPRIGRRRVVGLNLHVRSCGIGIVATPARQSRRFFPPASARFFGMARFAIANVLRQRDIPKTPGNGIATRISHGRDRVIQIRAIVDGMNSFRNGMTSGPLP